MTSRFPTKSTAMVTTTTVDSVGATQGARGVPGVPVPADPDQLGLAASPLDAQQLAAELFSGIAMHKVALLGALPPAVPSPSSPASAKTRSGEGPRGGKGRREIKDPDKDWGSGAVERNASLSGKLGNSATVSLRACQRSASVQLTLGGLVEKDLCP